MSTNKYPGKCHVCGRVVSAWSGILDRVDGRWKVRHQTCDDETTTVSVVPKSWKARYGRCEDAPACGCCD